MRIKALALIVGAVLAAALPAFALIHYVDVNSTNPIPPYTNWITAANVIQDAVDAATNGDTVLVTDGVYATGGKAVYGTMTNRVAVDKPLTLLSANGPEFTAIKGYQLPGTIKGDGAIRCVYLTNGAFLSGFTLTNGATRTLGDTAKEQSGGGLWCESTDASASNCVMVGSSAHYYAGGSYSGTLTRCTLTDNSATYSGGGSAGSTLNNCTLTGNSSDSCGGGSYYGELRNCALTGNSAGWGGGGSYMTVLTSCTLTGNSAVDGGGSYQGRLNNCIVYYNYNTGSQAYRNNYLGININYSCTTPMPTPSITKPMPAPGGAIGNITNAPFFIDTNGWADLRLQSNSPCINGGNNVYVRSTNDLDGNPRIQGGTVDMGVYEFQFPQSSISYAWLRRYGLPTDGSVDDQDGDGDKATTWQEWKMWTIPTNELSVLKMLTANPQTNGTAVGWRSVSGHSYTVERAPGGAASFSILESNIVGQPATTTLTDTTATNGETFLYRVGVPE